MLGKAVAVWVVGLLTLVPWAIWHLLFEATRDQYAALILLILFWLFGYWGAAGPLLAAIKVHRVSRAIQSARSREELLGTLQSPEARSAAVDLIASENHIPRFLAERVVGLLVSRLAGGQPTGPRSPHA